MDIEEIKKSIYEKIRFITNEDFPLEKDFYSELAAIRKHLILALMAEKWYDKSDETLFEVLHSRYPDGRFYDREQFVRVCNSVNKTYKRTNSWLENFFFKDYYLEEKIYHLVPEDWEKSTINNFQFRELRFYYNLINNALKYLKSENLIPVKKYVINIVNEEFKYLFPPLGYSDQAKFTLLIYLISDNRIIKLRIAEEKLISSTEHIIQKDLKKVVLTDDTNLYFYYHGWGNPDLLIMENYEDALNLRNEMNVLRERKVFNNK